MAAAFDTIHYSDNGEQQWKIRSERDGLLVVEYRRALMFIARE